ncbi:MAG: exodeoxyribonuclease VII small subunit [Pseudomonadota bacterium]|nr:exodeoxyribonuclease VII small subunit [Pseudomonadota bacterium]
MPKKKSKELNLEKSIASLETIVEELEEGDLPLEKALQKFEEGIKLSRECQTALKEAEQKVQILLNNKLEDFPSELEHED